MGWAGNMIEQNRGGIRSGERWDCGELEGRTSPLSNGITIPLCNSYWVPSTILKALHALPHLNCMSAL